jgi:hypothetical protein
LSRSLFGMDEAEKLKFDVDKQGPYKLNGWECLLVIVSEKRYR